MTFSLGERILSLEEAGAAIATHALAPHELVDDCLERALRAEPELHAYTTLDADGARAQARALSDEAARSGARGPLHGIPIAVKDVIDVEGLPTTASSRVLRDNVARADAPVVARLRRAGAVFMGKTNTHEFAYGPVSAPTRNPWDHARIPGGSSGGSAVAVATGSCLGALGTDTAGSIRIPAALCGVTGLRPTMASLPLQGIVPLAPSLDVCGPIAADARAVQTLWEVLRERLLPPTPPLLDVRVGVIDPGALAEPDVAGPVFDAAAVLGELARSLVTVPAPDFAAWDRERTAPQMAEALAVHRAAGWYPAHADEYTAETRASLRFAEQIDDTEVDAARRAVRRLVQALLRSIHDVDVLVLPTTPIVAPTVEEAERTEPGAARRPVVQALTRLCGPMSWCGLAAVSVPCGFTRGGLPVGAQLVARNESIALGAARAYQAETQGGRGG